MNCRRSFLLSYFLFFLSGSLLEETTQQLPTHQKRPPGDIIVIRELCTFAPATRLPFNISPSQRYHRRGLRRERQTSTRGWNSRSMFEIESVAVDGFGRGRCVGRLSKTAGLTLGLEQAEDVVLTDCGCDVSHDIRRRVRTAARRARKSYRDP